MPDHLTVDAGTRPHKPVLLDARTWWLLASGPAAWILGQLLGRAAPGAVEWAYGGKVGAALGGVLALATSWVGFSVAEWALIGFTLFQVCRLARTLPSLRRTRGRSGARAMVLVARDLSVVVAVFYLVWGLHYARPRLPERAQWPPLHADVELVARLAAEQTARANAYYHVVHAGSDDAGAPTALSDRAALDRALDRAFERVVAELDLPTTAAWPRGPVKHLAISPLLHRLGLSGFYFPFTGEANVNASVPAVRRAHVMAHEKAHQRGIGPEDEANFVGWRVAATAEDPLARYAAAVFARGQLVTTLARTDRARADSLRARLLPGVQRDLEDVAAYWSRHRGPAREVTQRVNHAYLRSNRVEGGVESYGLSARLLVRFALLRGGDLGVATSDSLRSVPSSEP